MTEKTGRCLCGAVELTVTSENSKVDACHCGMCRRWGGGPLMSVRCGSEVTFAGEENISVYESSAWAERGFCRKCGNHLFYRLKDANAHEVPVGLFDSQQGFELALQVFIDRKPAFYSFANITEEMTEAQVIEKFAPGQKT